MTSRITKKFQECFGKLPIRIQRQARKSYTLWKKDPHHPSLHFKKVHSSRQIYSVRVAVGWRALGVNEEGAMLWFWIGSHAEYDKLLSRL